MPATSLRSLLLGSSLLLALAAPAPVVAQVPLPLGSWVSFEWFLAPGPADGSGFTVGSAEQVRLRVTDAFVTGDAFDVFANGVLLFSTPSVPGGLSGATTGDAAWADPSLSKGEAILAPGAYLITIDVREAAAGFPAGEGFIRADRVVSAVPEPATVALVASGLAVVAAAARRRRTG